MAQTIIVPLDGSSFGERALPLAQRLAGAESPIMLVHVIARPEPPCRDARVQCSGPALQVVSYNAARTEREQQRARAYLDDVVRRYALPPGTTRKVAFGDPVTQILLLAHQVVDPLVVMTTTGETRVDDRHLGRVPHRLLTNGHVPVIGIPRSCTQGVPVINNLAEVSAPLRTTGPSGHRVVR